MQVTVWSDYICPWCYLGRTRSDRLRELGVDVRVLPFELHPELPPEGRELRPDGRTARVHDAIATECKRAGLQFHRPRLVPNSRRALETAEVVRATAPTSFAALDAALFTAHFVEGLDIGDVDVLDHLVTACGADASATRLAVDDGAGSAAVAASMAAAREHGIAATPAWLFGEDFVLPGVQPIALFERVVTRLRARTGEAPAGPGR
jgi:predicted DsbA family dithiol-disulfide isomerase